MSTSLVQKLRLWWRGVERRREQKDRDFLVRNAGWGGSAQPARDAPAHAGAAVEVDRAGLQAAYLDRSGVIGYYLDTASGEVVESRGSELAPPRYRKVPTQSEEDDRRSFVEALEAPARSRIMAAPSFRAAIAEDRALERAWYNFKNDRATAAIEAWLRTIEK